MNASNPALRRLAAALLASGLTLGGPAFALTLDETLQLAERQAPSLNARAAGLEAARQSAIPAGELPDPRLNLGLRNLPIEGDPAWQFDEEAMTMQAVGISQEVPNRAKRRARVEAAAADVEVAETQQRVARLAVRRQAAEAWINSRAVDEKLALFQQLYTENRLFAGAIRARLEGGAGNAAESVAPPQEAALLEEAEDQLQRDRSTARAALARWIGEAASQSLSGDWPVWPTDADHYRGHLANHPELQAFDPLTRRAEARVREAVADKRPDWSWGVDYQRREAFGDMVSLNLSMDLPIFAGSRQNPRIAAEQARLAEVEAERETALRMHDQQLAGDLAELQRLERALRRLDDTLLPLAEDRVRLAMADYRGGRGALASVIEARQALVETRLRRIDLQRDRALSNARLYFAFGETP